MIGYKIRKLWILLLLVSSFSTAAYCYPTDNNETITTTSTSTTKKPTVLTLVDTTTGKIIRTRYRSTTLAPQITTTTVGTVKPAAAAVKESSTVPAAAVVEPSYATTPLVQEASKIENVQVSLSLSDLILILMAKHGQVKTSRAFKSLDDKSLGEIMRILLVEVDPALAADIVAMQQYAQNSDKQLVGVIAKIVTGDNTVSKDLFMWDEKLRKFPWWARIRQRMFLNLDNYVANYKSGGGTGASIRSLLGLGA